MRALGSQSVFVLAFVAMVLVTLAPRAASADELSLPSLGVAEVSAGAVTIRLVGVDAECWDGSPGATCRVVTRYEVAAIGDEPAEVLFRTFPRSTVREADGLVAPWEAYGSAPAPIRIRPGRALHLEVTARVTEGSGSGPFYGASCFLHAHDGCPGMYARHALVGRTVRPASSEAVLALPPRTERGDTEALVLTVRHPRRWRITSSSPNVRVARAADGRATQLTLPVGFAGGGADIHRGPRVRRDRGGPFVGVGRVARERPLLRAGYEHPVATLGDVFTFTLSGVLETDTRDSLGVALVATFVLPTAMIFPSFSLGVGVPVQCLPDPAGGVRLELAMHARFLGLEVSVDRYPRFDAWRWMWALRVSL